MDKHDTRAQAADAEGRATGQVRVWDPLVRIGHWLLVAAFFTAYIAGDDAQTVHVWAGYTVAAIIAWRIVWGVVGSRHARFTDFVRGPGAAFAYLRGMASGKARRHLGHNPAGGLMILALIASLAGTTLTGMSLYAVEEGRGPNYFTTMGVVEVSRNGSKVATLRPEKRVYPVAQMPTTEAAIDPSLMRDVYVALGEPIAEGSNEWALRIYVKPLIRWIWLGAIIMALGGLLSMLDKRYRLKTSKTPAQIAASKSGFTTVTDLDVKSTTNNTTLIGEKQND